MQVDESPGFRTKSILCMPLKNVSGHVIGVSQLVNKLDGTAFNKNDENLFEVSEPLADINTSSIYVEKQTKLYFEKKNIEIISLSKYP